MGGQEISANCDPPHEQSAPLVCALPPRVIPPQLLPHEQLFLGWPIQTVSVDPGLPPKFKTYGAPRVFDLFTLLAITLAFAALFALLGLLAPALDVSTRGVTVTIGLYVSLVGFSQVLLFGSNSPRAASLISGPIALVLVTCHSLIQISGVGLGVFFALVLGISLGPITGYIAGAVVAGVFLVADKFRTSFLQSNSDAPEANFDNIQ